MTKHQIIEEPCEVKVSSTVLKTNGFREELVEFNLLRSRYEPKDLFDEVKLQINLVGGILSGDDTVSKRQGAGGREQGGEPRT